MNEGMKNKFINKEYDIHVINILDNIMSKLLSNEWRMNGFKSWLCQIIIYQHENHINTADMTS